MNTANMLLVIQIMMDLTITVQRVLGVVKKAQTEGRDVTPEELAEAKASARSSIDSLKEALDV